MFGDGGGFGTDNSDIVIFTNNGSISGNTLSLNQDFCISTDTAPCTSSQLLSVQGGFNILGDGDSLAFTGTIPSTALQATAVPFGVSPNTGLGILAGIWGVSRLRKVTKGRKSLSK